MTRKSLHPTSSQAMMSKLVTTQGNVYKVNGQELTFCTCTKG